MFITGSEHTIDRFSSGFVVLDESFSAYVVLERSKSGDRARIVLPVRGDNDFSNKSVLRRKNFFNDGHRPTARIRIWIYF